MTTREPWLTCQKGSKVYLFAQDERAYYFIDVDKRLDYATEEWLINQGVSEQLLRELLLSYEYIPKTAVKSVAIGGCKAGNAVYLYLNSGARREHVLTMDYGKEDVDAFFANVSRCTPPEKKTAKKKNGSWRRENRDPDLYEKFKIVHPVLLAVSILANLGYVFFDGWFFYLLCLISLIAPVVLDIIYPQYFTLIPPGKGKKADAWELEWGFFVHFITIFALLPQRNWLDDRAVWGTVGVCTVVSLLTMSCVKEFRKDKWWLLAVLFMGGFVGWMITAHVNEVFDFTPPESYTLMVEDLERSGGKHKSYECTVTLPDGKEVELEISRSLYYDLDVGDYVRVEHGVGLLGIEYANVYPIE